jgi:hypothetical protein
MRKRTQHSVVSAGPPLVSADMTLMTEMMVVLVAALTTVTVVVMSLMSARVDMGRVLVIVVHSVVVV